MVEPLVEPLLPYERDGLLFAAGARAGRWVLASGIRGEATVDPRRPLSGLPLAYLQGRAMYARAEKVLRAGGTDLGHLVRADQYFRDWRSVPFFHQARREACGHYIAPSTSVLVPVEAAMCSDFVASTELPKAVFPSGLDLPATSSFAPVAVAGPYVFVAGFMAAHGEGDLGGIAPQARVPEGHLWKGNRIQLEAEYILRRKLVPALEGAGCGLADAVKAVVYLADLQDVPAFNQVWMRYFGETPPATTFVPTSVPGFAIEAARCEINLVAFKGGSEIVPAALPSACDGHPVAVAAGDLVFTSGLMESPAEALASIADVSRALRLQIHYTDPAALYETCAALQRLSGGQPLPVSAVRVPGPLLLPEARVQLDAWIYTGLP